MVKLVFLNMDCCRDSAAANTILSAQKPFNKKDTRIRNRVNIWIGLKEGGWGEKFREGGE